MATFTRILEDIIPRVIGGIIVAAIAYFGLTYLTFFEPSEPVVIGISIVTGVLAAIIGWQVVEVLIKAIRDL